MSTNSTTRLSHDRTCTLNRDLVILTELAKELSAEGIACSPRVFATGSLYLQVFVEDADPITISVIEIFDGNDRGCLFISSETQVRYIQDEIMAAGDFSTLSEAAKVGLAENYALEVSALLIAKLHDMA